MQPKVIAFSAFKDELRNKLLNTLDGFIAEAMETDRVQGWKDSELPQFFVGVDAQAFALAQRINAGVEVNSHYVRIDMEV
jgi:hypothetical protein